MTTAGPDERHEVLFRGRVQGVGFRYTTRNLAAGYRVTGYVQNLADGRVRLVVEGEPAEANRFIEAVCNEMDRFIADTTETTGPATGEFPDFSVRT